MSHLRKLGSLVRKSVARPMLHKSGPSGAVALPTVYLMQSSVTSPSVSIARLWFQQRAGISVAGDGADSHDDFKPVQKDTCAAPSVQDHIEQDIKQNLVMVYMKGVPESPQCGFSAMVVRILNEYGVEYKTRNVLADPELRNGIKEFSKWPTIPQVYVNGEFVGGSDILISMHRSGELETLLKDVKKGS